MTTLRPAFEIALTHAGNSVVLRASLRAAVNIDNLDGGLPAVLDRLAKGHLTTVRAVIRASAPDRHQAERLLSSLDGHPLRPFMEEAQAACLVLVAAILPTPDDTPAKPSTTTRAETAGKAWSDYFADLFAYACGWLGWTPETAWNASADEIEAAFRAHVDAVIAKNGGKAEPKGKASTTYTPERLAEIEELGFDPAFDRTGLRALQARTT